MSELSDEHVPLISASRVRKVGRPALLLLFLLYLSVFEPILEILLEFIGTSIAHGWLDRPQRVAFNVDPNQLLDESYSRIDLIQVVV